MTQAFRSDSGTDVALRRQHGALCWRRKAGEVQVLLITSRDTGRWVLPKGWPQPGMEPAASAAVEAWEEAGVRGTPSDVPVGRYVYLKRFEKAPDVPCMVEIYPIRVERLEKAYPEKRQRQRKWFTPAAAAERVAEPQLQEILAAFTPAADL